MHRSAITRSSDKRLLRLASAIRDCAASRPVFDLARSARAAIFTPGAHFMPSSFSSSRRVFVCRTVSNRAMPDERTGAGRGIRRSFSLTSGFARPAMDTQGCLICNLFIAIKNLSLCDAVLKRSIHVLEGASPVLPACAPLPVGTRVQPGMQPGIRKVLWRSPV